MYLAKESTTFITASTSAVASTCGPTQRLALARHESESFGFPSLWPETTSLGRKRILCRSQVWSHGIDAEAFAPGLHPLASARDLVGDEAAEPVGAVGKRLDDCAQSTRMISTLCSQRVDLARGSSETELAQEGKEQRGGGGTCARRVTVRAGWGRTHPEGARYERDGAADDNARLRTLLPQVAAHIVPVGSNGLRQMTARGEMAKENRCGTDAELPKPTSRTFLPLNRAPEW
eukprot:COSAG04_NODE_42_length_32379_cov_41.656691_23_plen_233_part_00